MDVHLLFQAYTILHHHAGAAERGEAGGASQDNQDLFCSFRTLERVLHFPRIHTMCDDGE